MKNSLLLIILISLVLLAGCSMDDTEYYIENFISTIYQEKRPGNLLNKMSELLAAEIKEKKLSIYDSKEKLSEKYKSHSLIKVKKIKTDDRIIIYGLIKEFPRRGRIRYRTFLAKFSKKIVKPSKDKLWILYDLIIKKGKKLNQAKEVIKLTKISPASQKILKTLPNKVELLVFDKRSNKLSSHYIKEIASYNEQKISVKYYDPIIERGTASSYGVKGYGYIVIEKNKIRYRIKLSELFFTSLISKNKTSRFFEGERLLIMALSRVSGNDNKLLYINNHGERKHEGKDFEGVSNLYSALQNFGFEIKSGKLDLKEKLDPNTILLFADPQQKITDKENDYIENFILNGGRAVFLFERNMPQSFKKLISKFGLTAMRRTIVDPYNKEFIHGPTWMECNIIPNQATLNFINRPKFKILLSEAVGLKINTNIIQTNFTPHSIVATSSNGWAESNFNKDKPEEVGFTKGWDIRGPIPLAYVITQKSKAKKAAGRILIFGDCDFISNQHFLTRISNWLFFRETLNWLYNTNIFSIKPVPFKSRLLN